jgi:flagellar hook protein FlgE
MSIAFSNALSGLSANALAIDVVSGNMANINTTGYKDQTVSFQDLISQNLGGLASDAQVGGNAVTQTTRQFTQGSIQTTSQPYDAAIQGSGFFVLQTSAGQQVYSRAGNFTVDSSGQLLASNGQHVQGWNAVAGALNTSGGITNITLPVNGLQPPIATANFSASANLNASAVVGSSDGTFSSPVQVVDAQGAQHVLTITYTETSANNWTYAVTIPSSELAAGVGTTTKVASGSLVFDGTGHLTTPAAKASPITLAVTGLADGAADMNLNWNLYDTSGVASLTSFSQTSSNLSSTQDGVLAAQVTGTSIGANGTIQASYSNGTSVTVAQLALASVLNPDSMQDLGNGSFGITQATATPTIGLPGTGPRGEVSGGSLESSTVDIATEMTNLLTYERGYQANSKVVTVEDEILQSTIALKP